MRRVLSLCLALASLGAWTEGSWGCARQPPAPKGLAADTTRPVPRPRVEVGGCRHLEAEVCVIAAGKQNVLHLWIDVHAETPLELRVDGRRLAPTLVPELVPKLVPIDGGLRMSVTLEPGVRRLEIAAESPPWTEAFELELREEAIPAVVTQALADARSGEPERVARARAQLEDARAQLEGIERLAALQLQRKLAHGTPRGVALLAETADLAEALGRGRELADCAAAGAHFALEGEGDFVAARAWVERLARADAPQAAVWQRYYGGLLEARTGELGAAAKSFAEAKRLAEHIDMRRDYLGASEMHAAVLAQLNRGQEALASVRALLEHARRPELGCYDRTAALANAGWTNLLLAEAGFEHELPRPLFDELLELVEPQGSCVDPPLELVTRINLALAAIAEHEFEDAAAWLESLPESLPERLQGQVAIARDRVALETGEHARLRPLGARPRAHWELSGYWTDAVLEAETLARFGQLRAAEDAYLRAEAILDEASSSLGVDVGRELFLAGRAASVEGLVGLLVARGRADEALCRVRLARARELRVADQSARIARLSASERRERRALLERYASEREALAAERREDWRYSAPQRARRRQRRQEREAPLDALLDAGLGLESGDARSLGCDGLAPPRAGELLLVPFEGRTRRWLFAARADEVHVAPLAGARGGFAEALSRAPFTQLLDEAEALRVLAGGSADSQSLHALSVAGSVLLARAPLSYSLDLPARVGAPRGERVAVVVANPSSDLPEAEVEAEAVAELLRKAGWEVRHRVGLEATRARLSEDLGEVTLLHYAGHGIHRGASGWDAALLLGEEDTFSVADVLALPRVPELVVLTGCETATVSGQAFAGGMNLGRAFVLAGARWVVAADGAVDDALAREVGVRLHAQLNGEGIPASPAAALRRVLFELRARDASLEWERFRLLVP